MENKVESNIPIYRAKKIDSDEWVMGNLVKDHHGIYIVARWDREELSFPNNCRIEEINPTALAIHFPDMIASDSDRLLPNGEKDLRIFASLRADGRGGDIGFSNLFGDELCVNVWFKNSCITKTLTGSYTRDHYVYEGFKITGIKQ